VNVKRLIWQNGANGRRSSGFGVWAPVRWRLAAPLEPRGQSNAKYIFERINLIELSPSWSWSMRKLTVDCSTSCRWKANGGNSNRNRCKWEIKKQESNWCWTWQCWNIATAINQSKASINHVQSIQFISVSKSKSGMKYFQIFMLELDPPPLQSIDQSTKRPYPNDNWWDSIMNLYRQYSK